MFILFFAAAAKTGDGLDLYFNDSLTLTADAAPATKYNISLQGGSAIGSLLAADLPGFLQHFVVLNI